MSRPTATVAARVPLGALLLWAAASVTAAAQNDTATTPDPATIDVIGRRREAYRVERPGQSTVVRPTDPSRQDTAAQLARDASLALPDTGKINASGFVVPRVRGQDTRQTEVYVDDVLLQDPYTGLPLVDELDLRAFGELSWHLGVSPPEIHSVNPGGTLVYRLRGVKQSGASAGLTAGRPYGTSLWAAARAKHGTSDGAGGSARLYARHHATDGAYRYYSDNGTPYSTDDDSYLRRMNNERRAWQLVPAYDVTVGRSSVRALAVVTESEQGLPSLQAAKEGAAQEETATRLGALRWAYRPGGQSFLVPSRVALQGGATRDARTLRDPDREVLGAATEAGMTVEGRRGSLDAIWEGDVATLESSLTSSAADVASTGVAASQAASRYTHGGFLGLALSPFVGLGTSLELKGSAQRFLDTSRDEEHAQASREYDVTGSSAALGQAVGPVALYGQAAQVSRAPSLLEEFGDGARVLSSPELTSEKVRHLELGADWSAPGDGLAWRLGVSVFRDTTKDKILILPALAQATRAQNLGETRVDGVEARADLAVPSTASRVYGSLTRLEARDLTGGGDRPLPLVPERSGAVGLEQGLGDDGATHATVRWAARVKSDIYRDRAASIVVPGGWIHDAYFDVHLPFAPGASRSKEEAREGAVGLAVLNVFDVTRLDVAAPDTPGNRGKTAYSDLDGYPLPGRQWRLSLEGRF
jgi:hypothetical protein